MIPWAFTSFALPQSDYVLEAVANPAAFPIGAGLTFWSLFLINRLTNVPLTADFVSSIMVISIALVILTLSILYWKMKKISAS